MTCPSCSRATGAPRSARPTCTPAACRSSRTTCGPAPRSACGRQARRVALPPRPCLSRPYCRSAGARRRLRLRLPGGGHRAHGAAGPRRRAGLRDRRAQAPCRAFAGTGLAPPWPEHVLRAQVWRSSTTWCSSPDELRATSPGPHSSWTLASWPSRRCACRGRGAPAVRSPARGACAQSDGHWGCPERGPYDAIHVGAAATEVCVMQAAAHVCGARSGLAQCPCTCRSPGSSCISSSQEAAWSYRWAPLCCRCSP